MTLGRADFAWLHGASERVLSELFCGVWLGDLEVKAESDTGQAIVARLEFVGR